ncbi:ActS/PrrB/RegB family redox-sensitive histidine kinase [Beijerinckia indica]|uniref:histidine kinase n=1 Tax=Beijerinckia indica subsp. indica (strain ATCC 9039 / DSM 1715 / NCIMB 8712) TaxID=395963 RepID=B2IDV1_BEII9|nr:ActS/PrrB/RegB family redox-sensitive histidine kinase [Beijerinckia indica]ACB96883.1 integral membrane sensor signal transduction histidine kinase [Beijerinckia indica subsp. indica ATCC 9039]
MPSLPDVDLSRHSRRLRVDTLIKLRWLALLGQTVAVLVTHYGFGFKLPLLACLCAIIASACLNIGLRLRFAQTHRLDDISAATTFAYDILQLSALLYLTGGLQNPFSMLFFAPVVIAAVSLSGRATLLLTTLMITATTVLIFVHYPLPWYANEQISLPILYRTGIWIAIVLGASFMAIYASRVSEEARKLADALAATELVLAREQHLIQLDGLAAAAAHELGTPLATITLVARDLEKELKNLASDNVSLQEDIALLAQEVTRCRTILGKLTSLGEDSGDILQHMTLSLLLEEVVGPQRDFGMHVRVEAKGEGREPMCRRNPGILYGLGNLVENAIDFAATEVLIRASWTETAVKIVIEDDGPGFAPHVIGRLGEPYLTTRADRRAKSEEGSGLGLGLFIAKTLLERSGALVTTANKPIPDCGAIIAISWNRAVFEQGPKANTVKAFTS